MALVQRSSTLLLGPEAGWEAEEAFFESASPLAAGAEWFHIASTSGIANHLGVRLTSSFPHTDRALRQLRLDGDKVHLPAGSRLFPIKNIDGLRGGVLRT